MRQLVIRVFGTALSFYVTSMLVAGFQIDNTWAAYLTASIVFLLLNWIVAPILKLLLLPINLLTLGLFRWVVSLLVLYIFDILYSGVTISAYQFAGFTSPLISLSPHSLNLFWTLLFSSLSISLTYSAVSSLLISES